jgi:hypothetical protein
MRVTAAWPGQSSPESERDQGTSWPRRRILEIFVVALLAFLVWQGVTVWNGMNREISHFPQALDWAIGPRPAGGYTKYSLQRLNRGQPGRAYIEHRVRYVGTSVLSTGPFVVSVDAINADTLAMVARGDNGRCYAELIHSYGSSNQYGWTRYAKFPRGVRCGALVATISDVRLNKEPQ